MENESKNIIQFLSKLETIECLIKEQNILKKDILSFSEACVYAGVSSSYLYKKTRKREIPHFKPEGGKVFFKRTDLDNWRLRNPIKLASEINS